MVNLNVPHGGLFFLVLLTLKVSYTILKKSFDKFYIFYRQYEDSRVMSPASFKLSEAKIQILLFKMKPSLKQSPWILTKQFFQLKYLLKFKDDYYFLAMSYKYESKVTELNWQRNLIYWWNWLYYAVFRFQINSKGVMFLENVIFFFLIEIWPKETHPSTFMMLRQPECQRH